jgi:hypothetical protein
MLRAIWPAGAARKGTAARGRVEPNVTEKSESEFNS